ncbi:MAG TPA: Ig-like domain-containing protein, partial [Nitrospira sp.]|nr:Ig-like domain-containing protein [Nitrospira sp.]
FADMDVQPGSLQIGLVPATASTDNIAPVSVINSPVNTNTVFNGLPVTITGTSSDGNTVAGVEVSLDGGLNWQPAAGTTNWSYTWTPNATGTFTIKCRSFDDSGNMEIAGNAPSSNAITINVINLSAPENGPGGPVLVISNLAKPFSRCISLRPKPIWLRWIAV